MTKGGPMSEASSVAEPRVLLSGLAYVESGRWHDGRLWFAHWGTGEIVAVDLDGTSEVVGRGRPDWGGPSTGCPTAASWSRWRISCGGEPDGSMVGHADLSGVADHGRNEILVDGRGNIYLNGIADAPAPALGWPSRRLRLTSCSRPARSLGELSRSLARSSPGRGSPRRRGERLAAGRGGRVRRGARRAVRSVRGVICSPR
jgi:hypothetical protein